MPEQVSRMERRIEDIALTAACKTLLPLKIVFAVKELIMDRVGCECLFLCVDPTCCREEAEEGDQSLHERGCCFKQFFRTHQVCDNVLLLGSFHAVSL